MPDCKAARIHILLKGPHLLAKHNLVGQVVDRVALAGGHNKRAACKVRKMWWEQ